MAHKNSLLELEVTGVVNEQSREVEIVKTACRKRKPNFSAQEIAIITQKLEENQAAPKSKFTNTNTNKMKQSVWEEMTVAVNAVGTAHRSVSEVKEKWTNLQRTAKNELSKFRKEQRKTGGGPPPKLPSKGTDKILELLKDTPSFSGLQGFETGEENLYLEMISNPSDAADLPLSPMKDCSCLVWLQKMKFLRKAYLLLQQEQTAQHAHVSKRKSHQVMCFACSMKRCSARRKH
ncbi:uncharacterized protein LOC122953205 [Acropora millepora]|uniref:uncharacterized protein LOC122953205 n=1 Tax=Acropora millepora TaxID=45264 RepID=UPI001CF3998E|nr:uncharacterized protein LOC122953205 [Acropora millepora]